MPRRKADRNAEILRLREAGATLQEIGDKFGLSRERIRQIVASERRARDMLQEMADQDHPVVRAMLGLPPNT